jgi:alpha-ketoglutarate-dependent taurine dioxygenase
MTAIDGLKIEENFPAFISAIKVQQTIQDAIEFLQPRTAALQALILKHGALVFRGFPVQNAADFANFISAAAIARAIRSKVKSTLQQKLRPRS